ncbi:flagellin lysine-N-methylase [Paenibacillus gansuensis]|uniref:Flagellin lysine-N-methylase n=1 Tax=Paenibacillus gansuensis TaxID=306542 RepID=A0ABW5PM01_9BACL
MKKRLQILTADYISQFACIGSECEDTCCQGWKVDIDRQTYKKYMKLRDPELKETMGKSIKRNKNGAGDTNYAYIQMDSNGSCPLLTKQGLCGIQLKHGEEYLSKVCSVYPKLNHVIDGRVERSGVVSCPEVARKALLNPNPMEFNVVEEEVHEHHRPAIALTLNSGDDEKSFFWDLRVFSIQLLQNRNYTIEDRLIILGMFYMECSEAIAEKNDDHIAQLIGDYSHAVDTGALNGTLREVPSVVGVQIELLKLLTDIVLQKKNKRYEECFNEFLMGLGFKRNESLSSITANYKKAYKDYYAEYFNSREYIYENYLVNYVFSKLFPFSTKGSVFDSYLMLVLHYALIKMQLIGIAAFNKQLNDEIVIKLIQSFSRNFEHSEGVLRGILKILKETGYTQMSHLMILIKND